MQFSQENDVISLDTSECKRFHLANSFIDSASKRFYNDHYQRKFDNHTMTTHFNTILQSEKTTIFKEGYILPKNNDETINDIPDLRQNTMKPVKCSSSKWKRLSLVVKSLQRLKTTDARTISDINDLKSTIYESCCSPRTPYPKSDTMFVTYGELARKALKDAREQTRFFNALDRANEEDMNYIQQRLRSDPRNNFFAPEDRCSLVNKLDHRGFSPLYVACINGNINVIKLLLEFGANLYQYSEIEKGKKESNLVIAVKWNHVELVEFFLEPNHTWPEKDLKRAYKVASHKHVKNLLKKKMQANMSFFKKIFWGS